MIWNVQLSIASRSLPIRHRTGKIILHSIVIFFQQYA